MTETASRLHDAGPRASALGDGRSKKASRRPSQGGGRRSQRIRLLLPLALGLPAALGAAFWLALSVQRSERLRSEQFEDAARLLLAQRIAVDADRLVRSARRAAELLSSEPWVRASFSATTAMERRSVGDRLAEAADLIGAKAIRLQDASGRVLVSTEERGGGGAAVGPPPLEEKAAIALHVPVADDHDAIDGELVVLVPVDAFFDALQADGLGVLSVSAMDGRVVADAEGARKGIVLDAVSTPAAPQSLHEAGITSSTSGGHDVAFALVPSIPLMVSIADPTSEPETPWNALFLAMCAASALGGLGSLAWGLCASRGSPVRRRGGVGATGGNGEGA